MSKLIVTLVATLFAATAFAQVQPGSVPPTQPAAGTTANSMVKKDKASDTNVSERKAARTAKSKARRAKRDEKVGDKPIN
ncbi:MAG: hypothetical protein ABI277_08575 [Burkholderiaceae bacterium]